LEHVNARDDSVVGQVRSSRLNPWAGPRVRPAKQPHSSTRSVWMASSV
jgi:hypothetical protein